MQSYDRGDCERDRKACRMPERGYGARIPKNICKPGVSTNDRYFICIAQTRTRKHSGYGEILHL